MNLATIIGTHPANDAALRIGEDVVTYGELRHDVGALRGGLTALGEEMPCNVLADEILTPGDGQIRALISVGVPWPSAAIRPNHAASAG